MTRGWQALAEEVTEKEMIEMIVSMRLRADQEGWVWEDIEELADRKYWSDRAV